MRDAESPSMGPSLLEAACKATASGHRRCPKNHQQEDSNLNSKDTETRSEAD